MTEAKRYLLLYISEHSGHHQASIALEKAILRKDPACRILNINGFRYAAPVIERLTHFAYMAVIKKMPGLWDFLYDNPAVVRLTKRVRAVINTSGAEKIARLIDEFVPDAIGCTQAFPCGFVAAYKRVRLNRVPLAAVLTDYAAHSYWIDDSVDAYVVPEAAVGDVFVKKGVPSEKIKVLGTPVDPVFNEPVDKETLMRRLGLKKGEPVVLMMGGTRGIGPGIGLLKALEGLPNEMQMIMVCGVNKRLFSKSSSLADRFKKKLLVYEFSKNVHELMGIADIIITKPGGVTTAEALAKGLPMIILNPLPGQESLNTAVLTGKGMALKAKNELDAARLAGSLLDDEHGMERMRHAIQANAKPHAAEKIAELLIKMAG